MTRSNLGYVVVLASVLAACGGDDSGTNKSGDTGKGAAGKSAESSGDTLACGADTCKLPSDLKGEALCCKDRFAGGCGVKVGAECRAFPTVDSRCPPPDIMTSAPAGLGMMKVFGCCTSAGECGIDFGMGCMPRTLACMVVKPDQVDMIKHQKCTGEPLPLPANCGMGGFSIPGFAGSGGS
jgi:hypothetical protein